MLVDIVRANVGYNGKGVNSFDRVGAFVNKLISYILSG